MKTKNSLIIGAALAMAIGLSLDMIGKDVHAENSVPPTATSAQDDAATFYQPKVDGVNLDVRMMGHMLASPVQTAERFCRDNGFSSVAELMVRSSAATRTIADGTVHAIPGETQQTFAMIHCADSNTNNQFTS